MKFLAVTVLVIFVIVQIVLINGEERRCYGLDKVKRDANCNDDRTPYFERDNKGKIVQWCCYIP